MKTITIKVEVKNYNDRSNGVILDQIGKLFPNAQSTSINIKNDFMFDRYTIQKEKDESGADEFKIIDNEDLRPIESHDSLEEAEDALKFWNQ